MHDGYDYMLAQPYCMYLCNVGPHKPDVWLDCWYEKEWPLLCKTYLTWYKEGHARYKGIAEFIHHNS